MNVLISGASIAGPVLAYWLDRSGHSVTVVERAPALRKAGGHAVDLFGPALRVTDRMGLAEAVRSHRTGTEWISLRREGGSRVHEIAVGRITGVFAERQVEIMRDDLAEILVGPTRGRVEYLFGDSIAALAQDAGGVDVTFESGTERRFDLVIGADGLHSQVRRLAFGDESRYTTWIGAYLAVMSIPNYLGLRDRMEGVIGVDRMVGVYRATHPDEARAVFLFRPPAELSYHHRDTARQRQLLREHFADVGWEVPRLLGPELDRAAAFYFDSISQLRMETWSTGRISLAGDAGYCPGPAVGGSTSLAVVGAYVLAGELASAAGDHQAAFAAYEHRMGEYVRRSRRFAVGMAGTLIPRSRAGVWALLAGAGLATRVPTGLARALAGRSRLLRLHDTFALPDYPAPARTT